MKLIFFGILLCSMEEGTLWTHTRIISPFYCNAEICLGKENLSLTSSLPHIFWQVFLMTENMLWRQFSEETFGFLFHGNMEYSLFQILFHWNTKHLEQSCLVLSSEQNRLSIWCVFLFVQVSGIFIIYFCQLLKNLFYRGLCLICFLLNDRNYSMF